jgi:hypothetical protein
MAFYAIVTRPTRPLKNRLPGLRYRRISSRVGTDAYTLGKIPIQDFTANEVFFQIVVLAYNLLNWFKRLCVPPHLRRATLQRLRQRLFLVPAQLVRPDGVSTLRFAPSYVWASDFVETLRRIRRLRPPF